MFAVFRIVRKPLAAIAALVIVAACDGAPLGSSGPMINTRNAVPVALLVPGGSGQPGDDLIAASLENAARLAIADLGDVQIDLRVYNTAASPAQAAAVATEAVRDGAKIILGPVYAQSANAVGKAVAGRGVNVLAFSNNAAIAGGNVFVLGPTFENTANRLVRYAAAQGRNRVLTVHDNTVAGQMGRDAIAQAILAAGSTSTGIASYEFSQNGVIEAVPTIADLVRTTGTDTIFFTADTAGALPLLSQLLVENGIDPAITRFVGLTRWDIPPSTLALPGVQGGWFALPDPALQSQFGSRYQMAYGAAPLPISGLAYDGIAAIGALVKQGKADALTTTALTQGAGFAGVNGVFRLLANGTNERGLAVAEIRNNQVVVIDPAPRSFGGPGF